MDASLKASCAGFLHAAYAESPVTDMVMYNWWYDRHGAIQTSGLNFVKDLPRFLILLFACQDSHPHLCYLSPTQHAALITLRPPLFNICHFYLQNHYPRNHGTRGHRTAVSDRWYESGRG